MYYTFPCPKCGTILSEFENTQEGDSDAHLRLSDMVKQHYQSLHEPGDLKYTDSELVYAVRTGMKTADSKPY